MQIRLQILEDHTTQLVDEENNIIATIDPEEMSARFVQLLSMGFYTEVLAMVARIRELKAQEIKRAMEKISLF